MRVLVTAYGYDKNSISESITSYDLVQELKKFSEVTVLTRSSYREPDVVNIKTPKFLGRYLTAMKLDYFIFILKAYLYARKNLNRFDVIHHISPISIRYPDPLCILGKPFLFGPLGGSIDYPSGFRHLRMKEGLIYKLKKLDRFRLRFDPSMVQTLRRSRRVILTTRTALNNIPKKYRAKCVVIPEGIRTGKKSSGGEQNYIFSSGRLVPYKAFDLLIRAFGRSSLVKKTKLVITGTGPEHDRLFSLIKDCGLQGRVILKGSVRKKKNLELIDQSMFCVFPALKEAFGHVNIEAMRFGKPVIAIGNGGPADIVKNKETGFLINPKSPESVVRELKNKMEMLFYDISLRKKMGELGSNRVEKEFSWNSIGNKYAKIYSKIRREQGL